MENEAKHVPFTIELGAVVRDKITGFSGRVTGRTQYVTGCNVYCAQPSVNEKGEFVEARWFDEERLTVEVAAPSFVPSGRDAGACDPAPTK